MVSPTNVRFSAPVDDKLTKFSRRTASSKSGVVNTAVSEWLRMQDHPAVRFVAEVTGERRAALNDGPQVWTVVDAWIAHDPPERTVKSVADAVGLSQDAVTAALEYWADFREEVEGIIERHREAQDEALASWERRRSILGG